MTVSSISPVNNYTGNNSATNFDFDFLIENQEELVVSHIDKDGIIRVLQFGIDYSINEIGNKNGSYITFPLPNSEFSILSSDETISLSLYLPIKQESEFENSSNLNLSVLEKTFDYIVRILQILNRSVERCVKVSEGLSLNPNALIEDLYAVERRANVYAEQANTSAENAATSATLASESANSAADSSTHVSSTVFGFDEHSADKRADFDLNVSNKINTFDSNATTQTNTFNSNVIVATNAYNLNAENKTNDFNTNANQKQALVNEKANEAEIWAEGTDVQVAALGGTHSAKVWAEQNSEGMDVGMSSISESGYNKLEAQKAYLTGNVLADAKGYAELQDLAHSTFDLSKFEVVGTPTITADGVMTNYSNSNYVQKTISITDNEIIIRVPVYLTSEIPTGQNSILLRCQNSTSDLRIDVSNVNGNFYIRSYIGDGSTGGFASPRNKILQLNTLYIAEGIYNIKTGNETVNIYKDGDLFDTATNTLGALTNWLGISNVVIGNTTNYANIDLKYLFIGNNYFPIFQGVETGLDVLKPDNYTVVGSPSITADGVAGGFSNSNYIKCPLITLSSISTFEQTIKFTTSSDITSNQGILDRDDTQSNTFSILRILNGKFVMLLLGSGQIIGNHQVQANTQYYIKLKYDGKKVYLYYSFDGIDYTLDSSSTYTFTSGYFLPLIGRQAPSSTGVMPFKGQIDLNSIKVYSNGNLIYQPCLKIPYTLSKTGSKIVDVLARNRVQDAYEQLGEALYYTIDENNQNYTIPMGEVYGMLQSISKTGVILGQTIDSLVPLNDERLHLCDGALLPDSVIYDEFITDFIKPLYDNSEVTSKIQNFTVLGSPIENNGVFSNLVAPDVLHTNYVLDLTKDFEIKTRLIIGETSTSSSASIFKLLRSATSEYGTFKVALNGSLISIFVSNDPNSYAEQLPRYTSVSPNSSYDVKVQYLASTSKLYLFVNNQNITSNGITVDFNFRPTDTIMFGSDSPDNLITLDMNNTYVKGYVDGVLLTINAYEYLRSSFVSEKFWYDTVAEYGSCGKYVYKEGVGVRLPKMIDSNANSTIENYKYIVITTDRVGCNNE